MKDLQFKRFFILEMANNHNGDLEHGLRIIREMHAAVSDLPFQFAIKFQYRYLDTFVHPEYRDRKDIKLIKRFTETLLSEEQYKILKDEVTKLGFLTVCTPFDEKSVALIEEHQHDIIKIPSCYFSDWPLLEQVAQTNLPIIASCAGASPEEIDRVVSFFQHRNKKFAIMHCVAEYPTADQDLQLNQIELLRKRYKDVPIGFSTHESPDNLDSIKIAVAKGSQLFEKHVGVNFGKHVLNAYSADPNQVRAWVLAAQKAYEMCGVETQPKPITGKEKADLKALYRGLFAKTLIKKGERISSANTFLAMPSLDDQIVGNEVSKYSEFIAQNDIQPMTPVYHSQVKTTHLRAWVEKTITQVQAMLKGANVTLPNQVEAELSHHYGHEKFSEWGAVILNLINREYCKKIIILLPGQQYPVHHHKAKDETLHMLHGEMSLVSDGETRKLKAGDLLPIERGIPHSFSSEKGAIFEEISTTYLKGDSYYEEEIYNNPSRKTYLTFWAE